MKSGFLLISCVFYLSVFACAQSQYLTESPRSNVAVQQGSLSNKLKFFIVKTERKDARIRMRLILNAGRVDQDADQGNMAHLVEHLAFRSTKNFPDGARSFFVGKGLVPGSDIQGVTAETNTRYDVSVPVNDSALFEKALLWLHDCAGGINFVPERIAEERSAVRREYSNSDDPGNLARINLMYELFNRNPKYKPGLHADMENVISAPVAALLRFYNDWYHPMYQAVVITGDVNESKVSKRIEAIFADLSNAGARKKKKHLMTALEVELTGKNKFLVADPGDGSTSIAVIKNRTAASDVASKQEGGRARVIRHVLTRLMVERDARFDQSIPRGKNFRYEYFEYAKLERITSSMMINDPADVRLAIQEASKEIKRLQQYGFSEAELGRAKELILADVTYFDPIAAITDSFSDGRPFASNEVEAKKKLVTEVSMNEINMMIRNWLGNQLNTDIVILTPEANQSEFPSEKEAFSWMQEVMNGSVESYSPPVAKVFPQVPGGVDVKDCVIAELPIQNAAKVKLPNGAVVILKSMTGSRIKNKINISGLNRNVDITLSGDLEISRLLADMQSFSGIGALGVDDIKRSLEEKGKSDNAVTWVNTHIDEHEATIQGGGVAETVLPLINLYMTHLVTDSIAYRAWCKRERQRSMIRKDGQKIFFDSIQTLITHRGPERYLPSCHYDKLVQATNLYRKQFKNAADFTFVIVGSFDVDEMLPLVAKYIGALPGGTASSAKEQKDSAHGSVGNVINDKPVVIKGDGVGNVVVEMLFRGECERTPKNMVVLDVLSKTIELLLFTRLREVEQGVYGVTATRRYGGGHNEFFLNINFQTAPEAADRLIEAVKDEMGKLATGHLDDAVFANALRTVQEQTSVPALWMPHLLDCVRKRDFDAPLFNPKEIVLTATDITTAARDFLNTNECQLFKLL